MVDKIVYHYTDKEGWKNIFACKTIEESIQYPEGQF
jgi:hypothetical protein